MKEIIINKIGKLHLRDGKACEDACFTDRDSGVYVLADGVSSEENGGKGAEILCRTLGKLLSKDESKRILTIYPADEIRSSICLVIDRVLDNLAKAHNSDRDAFASTLLAFVRTSETTACLIHAGDGCIFALPATGRQVKASVLSYPDNDSAGRVYHAGHPEQKYRMRIVHIRLNDFAQILLATDGFSDAYLMSSFQGMDCDALTEVFKANTETEMEAIVERRHYKERQIGDDISCILLKNEQSSIETAAAVPMEELLERETLSDTCLRSDSKNETMQNKQAAGNPDEAAAKRQTGSENPTTYEERRCPTDAVPNAENQTEQPANIGPPPAPCKTPKMHSSVFMVVTALFFAFTVLFAVFISNHMSQLDGRIDEQNSILDAISSTLQSLVDERMTETGVDRVETETGRGAYQQTTNAERSTTANQPSTTEAIMFTTADTVSGTSETERASEIIPPDSVLQEETGTIEMLVG